MNCLEGSLNIIVIIPPAGSIPKGSEIVAVLVELAAFNTGENEAISTVI